MKPEVRILIKTETGALLQAAIVVVSSLILLAGVLRYRAVHPSPLIFPSRQPESIIKQSPDQNPPSPVPYSLAPLASEQASEGDAANQGVSEGARVKGILPPPSELPPQGAKQVTLDSVQTHSQSAADKELADRVLDEAQRLFEDGHYSEALGRCNALLVTDPSNKSAIELKIKIERAIAILEH